MAVDPTTIPLNTPTVIEDTAEYTRTATRTLDVNNNSCLSIALTWKANSTGANQAALEANVVSALTRLRQIKTQAQTFQAQAPYATANLASLNDLLTKTQTIAGAINDIATDLIGIARIISTQYDGTT